MKSRKNIIVIGGGAAGFFGAITAAESFPNAKVVLYEKSRGVLAKVRVSGGGRCNVTNAAVSVAELLKGYPRGEKFLKPLFHRFSNQDTIRWFLSRGVDLKTEPDGRMFPKTDSSETIIHCLTTAARQAGVDVCSRLGVQQILPTDEHFQLILSDQTTIQADRVLITTGGHPQATGYEWLTQLGISVRPPVPSLFTFNIPDSFLKNLAGVAVQRATVRVAGTKLQQTGPVLVTHWGLSGPAALKLSAWAARELAERAYQFTILVNWINEKDPRTLLEGFKKEHAGKLLGTLAPFGLPNRLWRAFLLETGLAETLRWIDLSGKPFNRLTELLTNCPFEVRGKTTFKEEFVTCGGVTLSDIQGQTMESKKIPGLYFAGEILDIDGVTGGYNFQAAWTTAWIAGKSIGL
ncbi:MAG: NAD(P)/FAD-dependent oxidoreductase [Siphonobacter sp.]